VCANAAQILLAGDSWTGGSRQFIDVFSRNGDPRSISNIGAGGSTCRGWAQGTLLNRLTSAVRASDVEQVWMICGGNDAMSELLFCTPQDTCVDNMINNMRTNMKTFIEASRAANPNVKIVGFGYDLFPFGAIHCNLISLGLFPDCGGEASCVNNVFSKFQWLYNELAETYDNFESVDIRGALQASQGIPGASVGNPNLDEFSPFDTFQIDCIHPNSGGYDIIFSAFYEEYWRNNLADSVTSNTTYFKDNFEEQEASIQTRDALMWQLYLKGLQQ